MGLVIFLTVAVGAYLHLQEFSRAPSSELGETHFFTIEPGQSFASIAARLEQQGLIRSAFKFRLVARLGGYDRRLKAGEYAFTPSQTPLEILSVMEKGLVRLHRLTIPEGLSIAQVAVLIEKSGLASAQEVLTRATDPSFAKIQKFPGDTLEGYLFPETYLFPKTAGVEAILTAMVQRFRINFPPEWERKAVEIGLSTHEIVTLASIIEKETGEPSERPLISSVLHNRLKRGMRLETDPTVIYGIRNFNGNLTRKHLETPSPYNTYLIKGLPPGPIANPGRKSLEAALFPSRSDYLFFVSRNNGSHYFSNNLEDHNRAVQYYQTGIGHGPRPQR